MITICCSRDCRRRKLDAMTHMMTRSRNRSTPCDPFEDRWFGHIIFTGQPETWVSYTIRQEMSRVHFYIFYTFLNFPYSRMQISSQSNFVGSHWGSGVPRQTPCASSTSAQAVTWQTFDTWQPEAHQTNT